MGSLLRPAKLKRLVEQTYEPGHSALLAEERAKDLSELHAAEDEAIRDAVRRQLDIGLDVVSDGEFRRFMFTGSFYDAVDGLTAGTGQVPFTNEEGELEYYTGLPVVNGELHKIDSPAAHEATFLKSLTDHPFKVTFPAASIFWFPLAYVPGVTDKVYATQADMVERMIEIEREQVAEAIAAGATYVQFDWPVYPALGDQAAVAMFKEHGIEPDWMLDRLIEADRKIIEGIPDGVRTALHLCRGNHKSKWIYNGPMDAYAERMFNELPYDVFLMEWEDTTREGDYSALRHVPDGPDRRDGDHEQQEAPGRDGRRAAAPHRGGRQVPRRRPPGAGAAVRLRLDLHRQRGHRGHPVAQAGDARRGRRADLAANSRRPLWRSPPRWCEEAACVMCRSRRSPVLGGSGATVISVAEHEAVFEMFPSDRVSSTRARGASQPKVNE